MAETNVAASRQAAAGVVIAVSVYVLVAIVKKRLALDASLYTYLQRTNKESGRAEVLTA